MSSQLQLATKDHAAAKTSALIISTRRLLAANFTLRARVHWLFPPSSEFRVQHARMRGFVVLQAALVAVLVDGYSFQSSFAGRAMSSDTAKRSRTQRGELRSYMLGAHGE